MDSTATIFIVDDDLGAINALTSAVEMMGFSSKAFTSAHQFLDAYDPSCGGCLLLDFNLPGLNGLGLLRILDQNGCRLPTILISGQTFPDEVLDLAKSREIDLLEKPFTIRDLHVLISNAIDPPSSGADEHPPS
jgi:two-component system, LuxR family, response regulator FixJ